MKNLNSLLARLGSLSLAAALVFSVADAAPIRKDSKAAAAVIEALVQQVAQEAPATRTTTQTYTTNVVVGSASASKDLTVYGDERLGGDLVLGSISSSSTVAGDKHIIGIQAMDPRTQQFELRFKDKTKAGSGAVVGLDFITTATSYRLGVADSGMIGVAVNVGGVYCHPQMTAQAIMGHPGMTSKMSMKSTATSRTWNQPARTPANDFNLTPTVRVEAITRDVSFGFVPYSSTYAVTGNGGFYDSTWTSATYNATRPVWATGKLAYRVSSDNVAGVAVVSTVVDDLEPLDVFDLFTDAELETLLSALNDYFGNDSTKVREYLAANRHKLSRAFKAMR
jgi:hypothetical protein